MYKIPLKFCILITFILLIGIGNVFLYFNVKSLQAQKNYLLIIKRKVNFTKNNAKQIEHYYIKNKSYLCGNNSDVKSKIKEIAQDCAIKNIFLKELTDSNIKEVDCKYFSEKVLKIKFDLFSEKQLYKFIEKLFHDLHGIVRFKEIKIMKNSEYKISIKITLKITTVNNHNDAKIKVTTKISPDNYKLPFKNYNLFEIKREKLHNVLCIIENTKAYIDNKWVTMGDIIDDHKIIGIHKNSIDLKSIDNSDNDVIEAQIGQSW